MTDQSTRRGVRDWSEPVISALLCTVPFMIFAVHVNGHVLGTREMFLFFLVIFGYRAYRRGE